MMKKFFSLSLLALLTMSAWAQTSVTLDFTTNDWDLPTEYTVEEGTFTSGDYTIKIAGSEGNGYRFNSNYLIFGKEGAYLTLPAFSNNVKKIEVVGRSGASASTKQNIFVNGEAISTETTGCVSTNTYAIPVDYQAAGTIYTLMITSNHNSQVTSIIVYFEDDDTPVDPGTVNTYSKVTSLDDLVPGKKYILVNEEAERAMGQITDTSTKYGSAVTITIADGVVNFDNTDVVELTLGEGTIDELGNSTWTFDMGGEGSYINWSSGNSLNTVTDTPLDNNAMWLATVTDDGIVLKNKADNTRILQYNASNPRFACYTSSQKPAVLYVQETTEEEGIANLSEANALEDDVNFTFNGNAVVTYQQGDYLFVRDESGYGQIYGMVDGTFENGQVLSQGWNATKTSVDGWVKFTDPTGISASGDTNTELAAAQVLTGAVDESMLNAYVCIEKVDKGFMPLRTLPLPDGTNIEITSCLWASNQPALGIYNIYGIICKDGGALKFNLITFEKYVDPTIRGDVNDDKDVNIADVTALIDYLLSNDATNVNLLAADCNLDGDVNIADVTALIDFLLSGEWPN